MSLVINTNLGSLNAQGRLQAAGRELGIAMERLSSGQRINSAADDAAGLAMSNLMTSQVRGLNQAVRNANDGLSMIQVAESALGESTGILQRMRELAVQSANGTFSRSNRQALDAELKQLVTELDRIAGTTSFNGMTLLDGAAGPVKLQVGAEADQTISFNIKAANSRSLGLGSAAGDLVGDQIAIGSTGGLTNAIGQGALRIDGQAIGGIAAGANLQTLLDNINGSVAGVTASAHLDIQAAAAGDGRLQNGKKLTISAFDLDGRQQIFVISGTDTLSELAERINAQTGNTLNASLDDRGRLVIGSDRYATVTFQDDTQGVATGINIGVIQDPDIANVMTGLNSYWISEAEDRILQYYGLQGDGRDMALNLETPGNGSDGVGNRLASISYTATGGVANNDLTLNIDMADYAGLTLPNGDASGTHLDRVIVHEMVHAVTAVNMNTTTANLPGWFTEGTSELIHGADDRVSGDLTKLNTGTGGDSFATAWGKVLNAGSPNTSEAYSVAYAAAKFLHDSILDATGGANGINLVFAELKNGSSLDAALGTVATNAGINPAHWTDQASFETYFQTNGLAYINGTFSLGAYNMDLTNADTGSVAGSDYGGPSLNDNDAMPNNPTGPAKYFNLVVPSQYAGGTGSFDARLVLTSETGAPVTLALGDNGSDQDLQALGFGEIGAGGQYLGRALSAAGQGTALATGDLLINGVDIGPVSGTSGLTGKVEAINAVRAETGVIASVRAVESFAMDSAATREYTSGNGSILIGAGQDGTLGLNGIGIAIGVGDRTSDIVSAINAATAFHGVTAYGDDSGKLHLFSRTALNVGFTNAATATALGNLFDTGATGAGSVKLNGQTVNFTDLADQGKILDELNAASSLTGVSARIGDAGKLELGSPRVIQVALGDTNGLQSLTALGISFGAGGKLADTNADKRLEDETFAIGARLRLEALDGGAIRIEVSANGETATGLKDLNASAAAVSGTSLAGIGIATAAGAQQAIKAIDRAIESIDSQRSALGAIANRVGFAISNLSSMSLSATAARSRILDADFASETAALSRAQVLQQASSAMLAQANAAPQQVLSLLR